MNPTIIRSAAAAAIALLLPLLAACGPAELQDLTQATGCEPGPVVIAIPDVSESTEDQTVPGGSYEQAMMGALEEAARQCGDVYSAPADGNSIGTAWVIDGRKFRQTVGGNETFGAEARARKARDLLPEVRRELRMRTASGTDLTGSLLRVRAFLEHVPAARRIHVVLITDGAINTGGAHPISMYNTPLRTAERRQAFVRRLAEAGELPDLGYRVDVYLAGVGVGIEDRDKAKDILATWPLIIDAMNARLKSNDSRLRYP